MRTNGICWRLGHSKCWALRIERAGVPGPGKKTRKWAVRECEDIPARGLSLPRGIYVLYCVRCIPLVCDSASPLQLMQRSADAERHVPCAVQFVPISEPSSFFFFQAHDLRNTEIRPRRGRSSETDIGTKLQGCRCNRRQRSMTSCTWDATSQHLGSRYPRGGTAQSESGVSKCQKRE